MSGTLPETIGNFEIVGFLGAGGQGQVLLGQHSEESQLKVAIKKLYGQAEPETLDMLLREAREMANLSHPNIVRVTDISTIEDPNHPYIVMEYLEDGSLRDRLGDSKPYSHIEIVETALRICDALHYAHGRGRIHRDIKPENILLDGDNPKLADWGLVKIQDSGGTIVGQGNFAGTYLYASPEQCRGEAATIDGRTDIYSLGIVLYEWITGSPPMRDQGLPALLECHRGKVQVPLIPATYGVPVDLREIVNRCIQSNASDRYQSVQDVVYDMERFLAAGQISDHPASPGNRPSSVEGVDSGTALRRAVKAITASNRLRRTQVVITVISITLGLILVLIRFTDIWTEAGPVLGLSQEQNISVAKQPETGLTVSEWTAPRVVNQEKETREEDSTYEPIIGELVSTPESVNEDGIQSRFYTDPVELYISSGNSGKLSDIAKNMLIDIPKNSSDMSYRIVLRHIGPDTVTTLPSNFHPPVQVFSLTVSGEGIISQDDFRFHRPIRINNGFNENDLASTATSPTLLHRYKGAWNEMTTLRYSNLPIIFAESTRVGIFAVAYSK